MRTPTIGCGLYLLNLDCPECGVVVEVGIILDTRLTVDSAGAKLSAKLNGKAVDHLCRQLRIAPPAEPDPAPGTPDTDPLFAEPERDYRQRAAGDMT